MKKIIAITAMVAAAAGIAFAAEASVTARGDGSLLDFSTKEGEKIKVLTITDTNNDHYEWAQGGLKFELSGEKAGGSFRIDGHGSWIEAMTVWCKPIDQLKLTIGDVGIATNTETIDYSKLLGIDKVGFGLSLAPIDGFTFDLDFTANDGYGSWLANDLIGKILAKAAYSADFGTASVVFAYSGKTTASATDSEMDIGGGFSGSAGNLSYFADVVAFIKPQASSAFDAVGFDAFASFSQDALTAKAYVLTKINVNASDTSSKIDLGFKLRADYSLGAFTPYIVIKSGDVIVDGGNIGLTIKPGFTTNVGECSIDMGVDATIKADAETNFKVSVPVTFKVNF